jgi:hypothetical protein
MTFEPCDKLFAPPLEDFVGPIADFDPPLE